MNFSQNFIMRLCIDEDNFYNKKQKSYPLKTHPSPGFRFFQISQLIYHFVPLVFGFCPQPKFHISCMGQAKMALVPGLGLAKEPEPQPVVLLGQHKLA